MNPFDIIIGILAVVSLVLILRNMRITSEVRLPVSITGGGRGLELVIDGRRHKGVLYKAEGMPRGEGDLSSRLISLASSSRINVTFLTSMYKTSRSRLLKFIDDEVKKLELAYTATKHVKYQERLRFLQNLYREVVRMHTPYTGAFSFIVWVPEDDGDDLRVAEAFKSLIEAETGTAFRRIEGGIEDLLSIHGGSESIIRGSEAVPIPVDQEWDRRGVVVGETDDDQRSLVIMDWPRDFEAHLGVYGPTGRGKTVFLAGISAQLGILSDTRLDPYMVLVIDPKGDLASLVKGIASRVYEPGEGSCIPLPRLDGIAEELIESSRETSDGRSMVEPCQGSLIERGLILYDLSKLSNEDRNTVASLIISSLALEASENGLPGRIALILDEAWRVGRGQAKHLHMAVREGRSKGLHFIYATQSPEDMPKPVTDNTRSMIVFGGYTRGYIESARRLGLDDVTDILRLPVGTAMVRVGDRPPVRVRILDFKGLLEAQQREDPREYNSIDILESRNTPSQYK